MQHTRPFIKNQKSKITIEINNMDVVGTLVSVVYWLNLAGQAIQASMISYRATQLLNSKLKEHARGAHPAVYRRGDVVAHAGATDHQVTF
jgi:hypothetical protein